MVYVLHKILDLNSIEKMHSFGSLFWKFFQLEKVGSWNKVLHPSITLWNENLVPKIWTNFTKHFQEVRRFDDEQVSGAWWHKEENLFVRVNIVPLQQQHKYNLKLLYKKYGQIHTRGLPGLHHSSSHIPTWIVDNARGVVINCNILLILFDVHTLYLLIGYMWTN